MREDKFINLFHNIKMVFSVTSAVSVALWLNSKTKVSYELVARKNLHLWPSDPEQAVEIQLALRDRLVLAWDGRPVRRVAGVDVAYRGWEAQSAIAVLDFERLALVESAAARVPASFPYLPGLLTFREGPAVLAAWEKLSQPPDLVLFDGQGIAHPRRFGLAAHLGLWLDLPSIGVAKSHFYDSSPPGPGPRPGDFVPLRDESAGQQVIGAVLRTRAGSQPLYVSPGHRMDVENAIHFVVRCCRRSRLPEPSRLAHELANKWDDG